MLFSYYFGYKWPVSKEQHSTIIAAIGLVFLFEKWSDAVLNCWVDNDETSCGTFQQSRAWVGDKATWSPVWFRCTDHYKLLSTRQSSAGIKHFQTRNMTRGVTIHLRCEHICGNESFPLGGPLRSSKAAGKKSAHPVEKASSPCG